MKFISSVNKISQKAKENLLGKYVFMYNIRGF